MPEPTALTTAVIDTADVLALVGTGTHRRVLLIERAWPPFAGYLALPGGHLDDGEDARDAAARELVEETGFPVPAGDLILLGSYDEPGRDPRGNYRSTVYRLDLDEAPTVHGGDDARSAHWIDLRELADRPLAFDHRRILADALTPR